MQGIFDIPHLSDSKVVSRQTGSPRGLDCEVKAFVILSSLPIYAFCSFFIVFGR